MNVNGINNVMQNYDNKSTSKIKANQNQQVEDKKSEVSEDVAAVYDKSEKPVEKKIYQRDTATIDRLRSEVDSRIQNLRDLVEKMLMKQGQKFTDATDMYRLLREGKLDVDPATSAQAQKDIAEDGYWGVNQTSERMVSFAMALSGGDPSKANEMIGAVKKGFEDATKAWGGELPDISKKTLDAAIGKLEAWRDSGNNNSSMSNVAGNSFKNQAATGKMAE